MLRLTTFGGLALTSDGVPMSGAAAQRSRLALLALLASAGPGGISRDKLLLYLWPESDTERARHALKQALYALRRELGNEEAIPGTSTLSLNAAVVECDLREFEQAVGRGDDAAAVAVYSGPFLDGVYLKDAPEFERWTAEMRARLAHDWCSAVERLAARAESTGDWRDAIAWRRQLSAAEPMNGRAAGALMRALAESGDIAGALQHFRVHEMLVRDELETVPEPDVVALADALRAGTWQRTAPVVRAVPVPVVANPVDDVAPIAVASVPTPVAGVAGVSHATQPAPLVAPRRSWRRTIGVAVVAIGVIGAIAYRSIPADRRAMAITFLTAAPARITPGLYVVAPLENLTGDTTLDLFGSIASTAINTALERAGVPRVDARTTSLAHMILDSMPAVLRPHQLGVAVARQLGASTAIVGNYSRNGDTLLRVTLQFIDMATEREGQSIPPIEAVVRGTGGTLPLAERVGRATLARVTQVADTTAAGRSVALVPGSNYDAIARANQAYWHFFQDPADTAGVFGLLKSARELDPEYTVPLLIRAYILDVKRLWPAAEQAVQELRPFRPRLSTVELGWLDLYESDLRGDPYGRLSAARKIMASSPKSTEMALVVVLSALYLGKPDEAMAAIKTTDPNRGIPLISPVYWQWRSEAEHEAERFAEEETSAKEGRRRFEMSSPSIYTLARVLATAGGKHMPELYQLLDAGVPNDTSPRVGRLDLAVYAARELRRHGSPAAADTILRRVADEQRAMSPSASRLERHLKASVLYDLERYDEARAILTSLATDPTDLVAKGRLGAVAVHLKDEAQAAKIDAELSAITAPYLIGDASSWRAHIAAARGRIPEAIALLRTAVQHGYRLMDLSPTTVHVDRDFLVLGSSPEFRALKRELASAPVP